MSSRYNNYWLALSVCDQERFLGEKMSDIPTDLHPEILRRLPADTLYQFRSVCKSWRAIIDDPQFIKQHMHHGIGNHWIILFHEFKGTSSVFLLPLKHLICPKPSLSAKSVYPRHTKVPPVTSGVARIRYAFPYPSCNGFILITAELKNIAWVIWNPFKGQSLELPCCESCDELTDYEYSRVPKGFGYVEATDDYKVVIIVGLHTYIYSVNLGAWRRVHDFPERYSIRGLKGASTNGVLHWIADAGLGGCCIIALNLNKEDYSLIPLPSDDDAKPYYIWNLEGLNGCLFLFPEKKYRFVLWMVDNYNGSDDITWIKKMSIRVEYDHIVSFHQTTPVAYLKSENRLLLRCADLTLAWYDLETRCLSKVSMEVNPDEQDHLDYSYHADNPKFVPCTQSFQVIPASLIHLKSDGKSSSKRKRKRAGQKFGLKVSIDTPVREDLL